MQGEECDGHQAQSNEMVEFGWNMIKVSSSDANAQNMDSHEQMDGTPPSTRNCHSSTQFGQYLIVFGGREGDGKKRIVNDIFIFDTEKQVWFQPKVDKHKLP